MPASLTPYADNGLLDVGDFIELDELLHPLAVGPIAILFLFGCLRLSSNRTVAPLTIWDGICSMALGSTLASIVNGQPLVRGILALFMLLAWQCITSWAGCKFPSCSGLFTKPPLIVAFRGHLLEGLMQKHRLSKVDIYGALRKSGVMNICEVECVVVEPTGVFSIFKVSDMPKDYEAEILLAVKGYRELVKADEEEKAKQKNEGVLGRSQSTLADDVYDVRPERFETDKHGQTKEDRIAHECA